MKTTPLTLILGWVLWVIGMNTLTEYVINRPMNGTIQFISVIGVLIATVFLISKTHKYVINNLNK
jgi:uncharacterized membrane protein YphA (DoxX/SURF4 family)